jgi:hypothetical protein
MRRADVAKAKNAGRTVKSKTLPGTNSPEPAATWREAIEQAWSEANA